MLKDLRAKRDAIARTDPNRAAALDATIDAQQQLVDRRAAAARRAAQGPELRLALARGREESAELEREFKRCSDRWAQLRADLERARGRRDDARRRLAGEVEPAESELLETAPADLRDLVARLRAAGDAPAVQAALGRALELVHTPELPDDLAALVAEISAGVAQVLAGVAAD